MRLFPASCKLFFLLLLFLCNSVCKLMKKLSTGLLLFNNDFSVIFKRFHPLKVFVNFRVWTILQNWLRLLICRIVSKCFLLQGELNWFIKFFSIWCSARPAPNGVSWLMTTMDFYSKILLLLYRGFYWVIWMNFIKYPRAFHLWKSLNYFIWIMMYTPAWLDCYTRSRV